MSRIRLTCLLVAATALAPLSNAEGLLPVNPLLNGDFEIDASTDAAGPADRYIDQCFGVGHQVLDPVYSPWGDWAFAAINDPSSVDPSSPGFVDDASRYWVETLDDYASNPMSFVWCGGTDVALLTPSEKISDPGFMWSNDAGTTFGDADGDGDREVTIPRVPTEHNHNLWQSVATATQGWSADFDAFAFRVESGAIPANANVQIGLSLTPGYMQSPWVGAFWEGAVLFRANDMVVGDDGQVSLAPVAQGEIICPGGYTPCERFRADYAAADETGRRTLLGQARIVQTSFWSFSGGAGPVVLDDVEYVGAKTFAETPPNPNPGA